MHALHVLDQNSQVPRAFGQKNTLLNLKTQASILRYFRRDAFFPFSCDYQAFINFRWTWTLSDSEINDPPEAIKKPLEPLRYYFPSVRYFFSASLTTSLLVSLAVLFARALQNTHFNQISVSHSFGQRGFLYSGFRFSCGLSFNTPQ